MAKKINISLFLNKIKGISLEQSEELLMGVAKDVKEKRSNKAAQLKKQLELLDTNPLNDWAEKNGFVKQDQTV